MFGIDQILMILEWLIYNIKLNVSKNFGVPFALDYNELMYSRHMLY